MKRKLSKALSGLVFGLLTLTTITGTADAIPLQSWDKIIDDPGRFKVLEQFNSEAVLDKETQLVWEQMPGDTDEDGDVDIDDALNWDNALIHCANKAVGGRKGWRLPSFYELSSLVDPTIPFPGPTLPPGHPFTFSPFGGDVYWSGMTFAPNPNEAWNVVFQNGIVTTNIKSGTRLVWCVRGGQGIDGQ